MSVPCWATNMPELCQGSAAVTAFLFICGVEHVLIAVMELFKWRGMATKVFKYEKARASDTAQVAAQIGYYNLCLAVGLIAAGAMSIGPMPGWEVGGVCEPVKGGLFLSVINVGFFGTTSARWTLVLTQSLPAIIGYVVITAYQPFPVIWIVIIAASILSFGVGACWARRERVNGESLPVLENGASTYAQ